MTAQFRTTTRPRLALGSLLLDLIDAHPSLCLALIVAGVAGTAALLVLA